MKKLILGFSLLAGSAPAWANAELQSQTLSMKKGIVDEVENAMTHQYERLENNPPLKESGVVDCFSVSEIKGAYLCISSKTETLSRALARVDVFEETSGEIIDPQSEVFLERLQRDPGQVRNSRDLLKFWTALQEACSRGERCPLPDEKEFFEKVVLPVSSSNSNFFITSFSSEQIRQGNITYHVKVSTMGMIAAQFELNPVFRETAIAFWNRKVAESDKENFKSLLAGSGAEGSMHQDEKYLALTFAELILHQTAEFSPSLRPFMKKYHRLLVAQFKAAGLASYLVDFGALDGLGAGEVGGR